jgi:hypothetical protein
MNTLEKISVGVTSLMTSWAIVGRPLYNFLKSNQEAEKKYYEEFNKAGEEYE